MAFPYQPALDSLRAFAVLAVIAYHNGYAWAVGGFLGVDAFFVLSGYLITTLLVLEYRRLDAIGLVAFWGRRIRRLMPALILVLLFAALYGRLVLRSYEIGRLRADSLSSLFYVANWRFIVSGQSYFDLFATPSPLRHLWSLAIEEQFYLVWPIVVLACLRIRRGGTGLLTAVCGVGGIASVVAMHALYNAQEPSRAYYGTDTRVHTLLVGALLGLALLRWRPRPGTMTATLQVGAALTAVAIAWSWHVVNATDAGYYGLGSLAYAIGVAIIIAAVVQAASPLARMLTIPPLPWIGRISYGLYLWHWPVIVWLVHWRVGFGDSRLVALRLVVTFALAAASYYLVEMPIRRGRWFAPSSRASRFALPVAVVAAAGVLVASTVGATAPPSYLTGGFPIHCPAPISAELRDARHALSKLGKDFRSPTLQPISVIGDSVSCSLWPGLAAIRRRDGLRFRMGGAIACGEASQEVLASDHVDLVPVDTDKCESLMAQLRRDANPRGTKIALWISSWERADLDDNGNRLVAGSKRWAAVLTKRMEHIVSELARNETRVVMVTMPAKALGEVGGVSVRSSGHDDATYANLNNLLLQFAARHAADVTLIDFAGHVCPGGPPCPRTLDGIAPRAIDGGHFTPEGSVWALQWLLPQIALRTAA